MVDYKLLQIFDIVSAQVEVDPSGLAAEVRCFDNKGNPVHLRMSRSVLEKLHALARRELERVPPPALGQS